MFNYLLFLAMFLIVTVLILRFDQKMKQADLAIQDLNEMKKKSKSEIMAVVDEMSTLNEYTREFNIIRESQLESANDTNRKMVQELNTWKENRFKYEKAIHKQKNPSPKKKIRGKRRKTR